MKKTVLLVLLLAVARMAAAQEMMTVDALVLHQKDATTVTYILPERPVLTYEGAELVVTASEVSARHALADIDKMDFAKVDIPTAISRATQDSRLIRATQDGVRLAGFAAGTMVQVYNAAGQLLRQARVGSNGQLDLPLTAEPQGVYVVRADKQVIKIKK